MGYWWEVEAVAALGSFLEICGGKVETVGEIGREMVEDNESMGRILHGCSLFHTIIIDARVLENIVRQILRQKVGGVRS